MEIKIKHFNEDYPRLEKLQQGDWIDLRVDSIDGGKWDTGYFKEITDDGTIVNLGHKEYISYDKGDIIKFRLGVAMELPEGYEAHVVPRSSTRRKFGLVQTNSIGIIDNSYNGDGDEWMVEFVAVEDGVIERFDRVCQFRIVENQPSIDMVEVEHLGNKDRGGYGSTGVK